MEHNIKLGISPAGIVSIVFGILGAVYLILGVAMTRFPADSEDHTAGIFFAVFGVILLVTTLILLVYSVFQRRRLQKIVDAGKYIWGEVTEIVANYNVRVNNRNPFILMVRYQDRNGNIHIFRSRNLKSYPDRSVIGKQVKVYYEDESYKHYYIDLEGILPHVIEH